MNQPTETVLIDKTNVVTVVPMIRDEDDVLGTSVTGIDYVVIELTSYKNRLTRTATSFRDNIAACRADVFLDLVLCPPLTIDVNAPGDLNQLASKRGNPPRASSSPHPTSLRHRPTDSRS